ncbi:RagB/SusD family nutrient uptake outer membrane protein [Maribellus maritimus]|uniref:RagB/SusD family nutrient uptake outer membrane protein n=1 Tax=Maribellus maritimus TaxID=2870838 RepID=UPI001EEA17D7|nr:RagB/SusD family nutrient uptake outer membrane protein [Maribellus maritimus]MCG6190090.1 RagB/SusD family nutrient uptake outer membrane protein [Maribellus maritimus]
MKKIFLRYSAVIASAILLTFTSCNDLDLAPTNKFTEDNYWTSAEKANMVLNMAYSQMYNNVNNPENANSDYYNYFFKTEALSDNIYEGRGSSDEKAISSGQADASNGRFAKEWADCYRGIKTCHTFLENVDRVPDMDEALKTRMVAEARFIRAYLFFRLTTWFGDVPLFDHDLTLSESKELVRTPKADVLAFVRNELDAVETILPTKEEYAGEDVGRITSGAVAAFKARTYLYSNDWENVVTNCEMLINSDSYGDYNLFSSYEGLFLPENEYNDEVILDLAYVASLRTWGDYYDYAPLSVGARVNQMAPTQELVDSYVMLNGKPIDATGSGYDENDPYVNRDPRLTGTVVYHEFPWQKPDGSIQTIYIQPGTAPDESAAVDEYQGQGTNSTSTGYYMRKYYDPTSLASFTSGLNLILIRYADVLLMYAEAKNELGEMNETVWNETIRAIRERAGFTDPEALVFDSSWSTADLRSIIRNERRVELALEGLRIFDLRRWEIAEDVLNGYPHGAQYGDSSIDGGYIRLDQRTFNPERDYLWAVPQSQKDLNPNLGQNPGY